MEGICWGWYPPADPKHYRTILVKSNCPTINVDRPRARLTIDVGRPRARPTIDVGQPKARLTLPRQLDNRITRLTECLSGPNNNFNTGSLEEVSVGASLVLEFSADPYPSFTWPPLASTFYWRLAGNLNRKRQRSQRRTSQVTPSSGNPRLQQ